MHMYEHHCYRISKVVTMLFVKHMKLKYTKGVSKVQTTAVRIKIAKLSFKVLAL